MKKKKTGRGWAIAIALAAACALAGPASAEAPVKLVSLTSAMYGSPGVASLRSLDRSDDCAYSGEVKWDLAAPPGGNWVWATAPKGERRGVFRVSVRVERMSCADGKVRKVSFVAPVGDVMVDEKEGKVLSAGFSTQVDAGVFRAATGRK